MVDDMSKPPAKAMQLAATESGNPERSFRVMYSATLKKLKDKECFIDEQDDGATTPVSAKGTTKKRKNDGDATSPTAKKVARGKQMLGPIAAEVEADAEEI
jgi:hypothetical protein